MSFTYKHPRMLVTVDALVFTLDITKNTHQILLIQRKNEPFKNSFALPGGFVEMDELLHDAATRELFEETGLQGVQLHQLGVFDAIDRDPRDRNICVAFYGFATTENSSLCAGDDAEKVGWFSINDLPKLAFDHPMIIEFARKKLNI